MRYGSPPGPTLSRQMAVAVCRPECLQIASRKEPGRDRSRRSPWTIRPELADLRSTPCRSRITDSRPDSAICNCFSQMEHVRLSLYVTRQRMLHRVARAHVPPPESGRSRSGTAASIPARGTPDPLAGPRTSRTRRRAGEGRPAREGATVMAPWLSTRGSYRYATVRARTIASAKAITLPRPSP